MILGRDSSAHRLRILNSGESTKIWSWRSPAPQHPGGTLMVRVKLAPIGIAAAFVCSTSLVSAAPFKCPRVGGEFVFGQEANVNSLDQMTSSTISTRNIAMNIFETLMTRDENNNPIPDLAESMTESPDRLTYTFKIRQGVKFHNGKPMTSADVRCLVRPLQQDRARARHVQQRRRLGRAGCVDLRDPHEAGAADLHRAAQLLLGPHRHHPGGTEGRSGACSCASSAPGRCSWSISRRAAR